MLLTTNNQYTVHLWPISHQSCHTSFYVSTSQSQVFRMPAMLWVVVYFDTPQECSSSPREMETLMSGISWIGQSPSTACISELKFFTVVICDFVCRSHEPTLAQNVSSMPVTSVHPWPLTCKWTRVCCTTCIVFHTI